MSIWSRVQAAIEAARKALPPEGHPLRGVALQAVTAAEECARARTPKAASEAEIASFAAVAAEIEWEAETADAAVWAVRAAGAAAGAAMRAVEGRAEAAEVAASWAIEAALEAASKGALS